MVGCRLLDSGSSGSSPTFLGVDSTTSKNRLGVCSACRTRTGRENFGRGSTTCAAVSAKNKLQYYVDDLGGKYETQCNFDYSGSDIYVYGSQSWKDCLEACSARGSRCAGAGWVLSRPYWSCYLKSAMNNKTPDTILGTPVFCSIKVSSPFKNRHTIEVLSVPTLHRRLLLSNGTYYGNETVPTNSTLSATDLPTNVTTIESTNTTLPIAFTNSTTLSLNTIAPIVTPYANVTLPLINFISPLSLNSTSLLPLKSTSPSNSTIPQVESTTSRSVRIVDTTNTLLLNPPTSGNLFVSVLTATTDLGPGSSTASLNFVASTSTTSSDLSIWSDSAGRFLHYYPSSIATLGVSRLRLANWEFLPLGAKLVSLIPFTSASGGDTMLVAVDTDGHCAGLRSM